MKRQELTVAIRERWVAALVALAAGGAAVAGSYAAAGFTPSYVVAPVETVLARYIPGAFITFAIVVLGDLGKQLSLIGATLLSTLVLGTLAGLGRTIAEQAGLRPLAGPFAGIPVWGATAALTGRPVLSLGAGLAAALVVSLAGLAGRMTRADDPSPARRRVVTSLAGLAGLGTAGWLLGNRRTASGGPAAPPTPAAGQAGSGDDGSDTQAAAGETPAPTETEMLLAEAEEKSFGVDGLEPLVSEEFYHVDISSVNPQVQAQDWSLSVTGAVPEETSFDYQDIIERESTLEFSTLRCVGERLNGKKTDTALWEGVRVGDLLEAANVPDRCCVMARGADSFFEEFPVAALRESLLVYRMNGDLLPRAHGYPARLVVPGHWGEIHVKWVDELEILDEPAKGYWEKKGWHGTGPVNTVAKLYAVNDLPDGRKQVAGHSYAGTRGIRTVEVSTDGGSTWNEAELTEELPGRAVWRQWRYDYEPPGSTHEVVVRAVDGEGTLQPEKDSGPYPSGPSGWVSRRVD
jgi:DMSO/TMAO reductase YedYZ molybdopterin-dependent catalytic subunit